MADPGFLGGGGVVNPKGKDTNLFPGAPTHELMKRLKRFVDGYISVAACNFDIILSKDDIN